MIWKNPPKPTNNFGHGHVRPRLDGVKARCGGPAICKECALEQAQLNAEFKLPSKKAKPSKVITPEDLVTGSEDGEQAALFCWAAMSVDKYPELKWLHSIPNGGSRHIAEASKMVATGLRVGIWDIFLPCPMQTEWAKQYAGCYIEMKRADRRNQKNGGLTEEQLEFKDYAVMIGYYCRVCYSWIEARDTLVSYLEGKL